MAFQVLTAAVFVAQAIGTATSAVLVAAASAGAAGLAAAASLASIAYTSYATKKAEADARKNAAQAPRDITVRSATEPAKIIYGKARTSGPVVYTNTAPTPGTNDNNTLWTVISLCSHEVEDITDIWLDGDEITASQINWGGTGGVTSGKYGPIGANEVTNFYKRLGTSTQAHVSELATAFNDWTSSYQGKNVAYIVSAFELGTATGEGVWAQGAPTNIRAVVKGKKVYDPRKDSTNGGSGAHRLADPSTWEWSDNPALCLADYLFDDRLGLGAEGVTYDDIDWPLVIAAANVCDATVSIPGGTTEKRFTCNGALSTGNTYAENIKAILSSMDGQITWSGGKYRIRACAYEAPVYTFTGDDVVGDVQIQPERTRAQRFNTVRGTFVDPESDYVATEFIPYTDSNLQSGRDAGQKLTKDIALPMTNSEYMAQRLAYKIVALNDQQLRCIVPMNWKALKVGVGDRIQLSIDELSWSNKVFRVEGWAFDPDAGFNLTLQEDSSSSYADPGVSDYSTRTLAGTVVFADQPVPSPSNLSATAEEEAVFLQWANPGRASGYDEIIIYASANSSWASASEVARTRGNSFRHELARGTQRYYWIRAVDVDGETSIRNPNSDTSSITATAGQIDFANLGGATKPADNATRNTGALADLDTVDTDQIENNAVDITKIADTLQSTNYSAGSAGWKLTTDGTFEAGDGTFRGDVTAKSFTIEAGATVSGIEAQAVAGLPQASFTSIGASSYSPAVNGSRVTWTETGTEENWNTKLVSDQSFSGGAFITFVVNKDNANNSRYMVGLANTATGNSFSVIDYAVYVNGSTGNIQVYESGSPGPQIKSTITAGDIITVFYDGNKVQYIVNGTVEREVSLTSPLTGQVYAHIAIDNGSTHDVEHRIDGLQFGPVTSVVENLNDGVSLTSGGLTLSSGGSIKGGQTAYDNGTGFFLGYENSAYKLSIGDSTGDKLTFNGADLTVTGDITATSLTLSGTSITEGQLESGVQDSLALADSALQIGDIAEIISAGNIPTGQLTFNDTGSKTVSYDGNNISVTGGNDNSWDTQVYSSEHYASPCVLQFETTFNSTYRFMMGLNEDPTTNASYNSIDYSWYLNTSTATIYENGSQAAPDGGGFSFSVGDKFSIVYDGDNVYYYHNDTLKRTVTGVGAKDFYLDSSLYDTPLTINDVRFAPISRIDYGSIGGVTITPGKLYQGTGTFNNANTGFYLDSAGQLSLKDKLSFNGTTLAVDGNVTAQSLTLASGVEIGAANIAYDDVTLTNVGGNLVIKSGGVDATQLADGAVETAKIADDAIYGSKINAATTIVAGSGTNTAALSGVYDYRFWAGGETPAINLPFLVHKDGTVYARKMVLKDSAGNELFNSETGFTNLSINQIVTGTGSTAIKVTTYSEAFTDNNGEVEITLSQMSNLKVGIKIDASWDGIDINPSQTTAETNAVADIPSQVQLGVGYASSAGGTFVSSSTGTFSRVTTLSGTPSDEYLVEVTSFYEPEVLSGGAYIASATVQTDEPTSAVGPFGYILYEYTFSNLPAGTYYFRTTASGTGGSGSNVVNSSYDRTIEITDLTTDGGFVVDGGGSQTVGQADITSVTAGTNLTGGGLSGGVTLNLADDISLSNITLSGYLRGPASFTIDPAAHGDDTGTVVIAGNLQVDGTTTTINSTTLTVDDKNIVLADGAANAAAADGAGITIDGASASFTYNSTADSFRTNKRLEPSTFRINDSSDMGFGITKAGSTVGHTASVDEGIFWHTTNDYGIYRTAGAWTNPDYPYLKVAFGTGIKLDGGTAGQYTHTGVDIVGGSDLQMAGNTVIDASRNITAGTISSGAITSSGTSTFDGIRVNNSNTALSQGGGNSLRIQTNSGYVEVGPQNTGYAHFNTDRAAYYFEDPVHFDGQIYNYNSGLTDQPYWHEGNLPNASLAKVVKGTVTGVNSSTYVTAFTVVGSNLSSSIRCTFHGTSNSVVVNALVDLQVNHSQDILISSMGGFYTKLTIKVVSNNNEAYAVEIKHNGSTTTPLAVEVFPLNSETVTFATSHSYTGSTLEHVCEHGLSHSGTGGVNANITTDGYINPSDGYKVGGTTIVDSTRRFYVGGGSIQHSGRISFLDGSNGTTGSGAQGIAVQSLYAGTSYSNTAPTGMVNALNGYQVGNTTIVDSSRNASFVGVEGTAVGVNNTSSSSRYGIALYGGSGSSTNPTYGLMFTGTSGLGTHGYVTGDWATYLTMNNSAGRGWIFRNQNDSTNVASITNTGIGYFNGTLHADAFVTPGSGPSNYGVLRIMNPGGAERYSRSGVETGAIKIRLPQTWTNTMLRMTIQIYDYASDESFTVMAGGYNYASSSSWTQTSATTIGSGKADRNFTVRFAHDGTKCCIFIGELDSTWTHAQVAVTEFLAGFSNASESNWKDGWEISIESTSFGTVSRAITNTDISENSRRLAISGTEIVDTSRNIKNIGAIDFNTDISTGSRYLARPSNWGYSASYKAIVLGSESTTYSTSDTGSVTLSFNYDPSVNANGSFTGDGREIVFRNGTQFVTPNSANTAWNLYNLVLKDGHVGIGEGNPQNTLSIDSSYTNSVKINGTGSYDLYSYHDAAGVGWATGPGTSYDTLIYMQGQNNYIRFYTGANERLRVQDTGANIISGGLLINGTEVIDSSRNLTNIGNIGSTGQITGDDVTVTAGDGDGYGFWSSGVGGSYRIYMSSASNTTHGGQVSGETTSDYNMYFKMEAGANRGFVFRDANNNFFSINPDTGVHSEVQYIIPNIQRPVITASGNSSSDDQLLTRWRYANADSYYLDMHQRVTSNQLRWAFSVHNNGSDWSDRLVFKNENVGIGGLQDPAYPLHVNGTMAANGIIRSLGGHGGTRVHLEYQHNGAEDAVENGDLVLWASEPGLSYDNVGIGGNINPGGQYYGRADDNNAYGVYMRFDVNNGLTEFWNTTGAKGTTGGQGTRRAYIDATGGFHSAELEVAGVLTLSNSSDRSGLLDIQNTGQSWTGVQFTRAAGDHWSLMGDDSNFGLYDDENGEWILLHTQNGATELYHNGTSRIITTSTGFESSYRYVANQGNSSRDAGYYGSYNPARLAHIWSMGTAYDISADGTSAGNIYGLTYSYNPDYQGTGNNPGAISNLGHQMQWRSNGTTQSAIGTGIYTIGNVTAYSDRRVKTNIERIPDALDKVCRLNGYTYERTDLGFDEATGEKKVVRQAGVIAQEVLEVLPEVVTGSEELHYGVAYGNMVGLLIEAIKELKDEVDSLKSQLKEKDNGDH